MGREEEPEMLCEQSVIEHLRELYTSAENGLVGDLYSLILEAAASLSMLHVNQLSTARGDFVATREHFDHLRKDVSRLRTITHPGIDCAVAEKLKEKLEADGFKVSHKGRSDIGDDVLRISW